MLLRPMSDLHLEFDRENGDSYYIPPHLPTDSETVLVLAGDINTKGKAIRYANILSSRFKAVILVGGNHDYWGGNYSKINAMWKEEANENVYPLNNTTCMIDDVIFTGGTLWTDYKNRDSFVLWNANNAMPDYRNITDGDKFRKFTPTLALHDHMRCVQEISASLRVPARKHVVVTHMAPSYLCSMPPYSGGEREHYFCSNLDELVCQADMWIFGHTHQNLDKMVGQIPTRLLSNQRGYAGHDLSDGFAPELVIEI